VLHSHYGKQARSTHARNDWAYVQQIQDLSMIMPPLMHSSAKNLQQIWQQHWENLGAEANGLDKINQAIDELRKQTLTTLRALD